MVRGAKRRAGVPRVSVRLAGDLRLTVKFVLNRPRLRYPPLHQNRSARVVCLFVTLLFTTLTLIPSQAHGFEQSTLNDPLGTAHPLLAFPVASSSSHRSYLPAKTRPGTPLVVSSQLLAVGDSYR